MNVIGFKIYSDFGHFRKHYTNMSAMSFFVPPRTAIAGIVGAIIGIDRSVLYDKITIDNCFISIIPTCSLQKRVITQNYLRGWYGGKPENKNPTNIQLIYKPQYIIYFKHDDNSINDILIRNLQNHEPVYVPYMGNNRHILNFEYIGQKELEQIQVFEYVNINSVLEFNKVIDIKFNTCNIARDTMCAHMTSDKTPILYKEYILSINNTPVTCKINTHFYKIDNMNIVEY